MFRLASLYLLLSVFLLSACDTEAPTAGASSDGEAAGASLPRTPAPDGARLYFVTPADGDSVTSPVSVEFGLEGMAVVPAGQAAEDAGHHHLIIDAPLPALDRPIPADEHYVHFGDGSTRTELTLPPGQHTLRLLLGDHLHIPHDPPVISEAITITVQ